MKSLRHSCGLLCATLSLVLACGSPEPPSDPGAWAQWRGPSGLGISDEADLPEAWSKDSANVRWVTRIPGSGNSSPIVSHGRVFLTTTYGKSGDSSTRAEKRQNLQFVVMAVDIASGEILWRTTVLTGPRTRKHWFNTLAAPTPATDGERVFASFGPILAALDRNGNLLWVRDIDPEFRKFVHYGSASSPILTDRGVVVMQDSEESKEGDPGWIALFDKETGERIWRQEWTETCCSYTTPLLHEREGTLELINSSARRLTAFDPETGTPWWTARHRSTQPVPSMIVEGDLLVAPGGIHSRATTVLRLTGKGTDTRAEQLWENPRGAPEIASPLLYRGWLFRVTEKGVLTAADPETGKIEWRERLSGGIYRISLVAGDGKVYATNGYGTTTVVEVGEKKPKVVSINELGDGGNASPALGEGCFLYRSVQRLYCVERGDAVTVG